MNKKEYMSCLRAALGKFSEKTQQEVLEDYESHFSMGLESGRTEEEICRELGPIDLFIEELSQMEPSVPLAPPAAHPSDTKPPVNTASREAAAEPCEYHSSGFRKLVLEGLHADVSLTVSPDDSFHIYYENSGTERQRLQYRFYYREENDTIYTGIRKSKTMTGLFGSLSSPSINLTVRIPASMTNISVSTISGDVETDGLRLPVISLSSTSGDITASHLDVQKLNVNTTSGDIELPSVSAASCEASSVSGDIHSDGRFGFSKLNTVSGDIEFYPVYDTEMKLNTVSGDIELRPRSGVHGNVNSVSGDIELDLNGSGAGFRITFSTVSGDFDIHRPCTSQHFKRGGIASIPGEGDYPISAATTSGDFTIR